MIKRRLIATLLVSGALSMPGPAFAHGEPVYNKIYYSDATYTEQVGYAEGGCNHFGAGYAFPTGQTTNYVVYEPFGYCFRGEWHEEY
jgi:hypothetical protein